MAKVQVQAIKKIGKYQPGDIFEMGAKDAHIFKRSGVVTDYSPPRRTRAATPAETEPPASTESAPAEQPPAQPAAQEPGTYGRRDMQPEA